MNTLLRRVGLSHCGAWGYGLGVCLLAGCAAGPGPSGGNTNDNGAALQAPRLSADNRDALDDASEAYLTLRDTLPPAEARARLVEDINAATNGAAEAELCDDGYTIWLNFRDGQVAAINTGEMFSVADEAGASAKSAPGFDRLRTLASWPTGPVQTPQSRKVLLMSPAAEVFSAADLEMFEALRDELIETYHWDARDITIKRNEFDDDRATLSFYDFFRLNDYGVIVILAHGIFRDAPPPAPLATPPPSSGNSNDGDPFDFGFRVRADSVRYFYIQVSAERSDPTDPDPYDFGFRTIAEPDFDVTEEMRRGRIILVNQMDVFQRTRTRYYYMREDLWAEHVEQLPGSIVYVCAPNLYRRPRVPVIEPPVDPGTAGSDPFNFGFRVIAEGDETTRRTSVLEAHGVGSVLGWDYLVPGRNALDAVRFITDMAAGDLSDIQALAAASYDTSVLVTVDALESWTAELGLLSSTIAQDRHTFLPTWADVSFTKPPDGTVTTLVSIEYTDQRVPLPAIREVEDIPHAVHTLEGLFPGVEAQFTAEALDATGRSLQSIDQEVVLHTGGNPITMDFFEVPHSFVLVEVRDPDPTAKGPTWGWTYYLSWDEVPGAVYYDVTIDRKGRLEYEGQEPVSVERALPPEYLIFGNFEPPGVDSGKVFLGVGGYTTYYGSDETNYPQAPALQQESEMIALYETWAYTIRPYFDTGN